MLVLLRDQEILKYMKKGTLLIDHKNSSPKLVEKIFKERNKFDRCLSKRRRYRSKCMEVNRRLWIEQLRHQKYKVDIYNCWVMLGQLTYKDGELNSINRYYSRNSNSLFYGHKCKLNLEQLINIIKRGEANSTVGSILELRMVKENFEPGFYVEQFIKDLSLPELALVKQQYHTLVVQGGRRNGTQVLLLALETLNKHKIR